MNLPQIARVGVHVVTGKNERKLIHISVVTPLPARGRKGKEPGDWARGFGTDKAQRRQMFEGALKNMKILAEGGTLPPRAPRGAGPGGGQPK